jgi:hypothetical protein
VSEDILAGVPNDAKRFKFPGQEQVKEPNIVR